MQQKKGKRKTTVKLDPKKKATSAARKDGGHKDRMAFEKQRVKEERARLLETEDKDRKDGMDTTGGEKQGMHNSMIIDVADASKKRITGKPRKALIVTASKKYTTDEHAHARGNKKGDKDLHGCCSSRQIFAQQTRTSRLK